ncbi:MAG TPA: hypothetical protein VIW28_06340 [Gemmatimonadales bacterium]
MKNRIPHLMQVGEQGKRWPELTGMLRPCQVWMLKTHLALVLEMSLEAIEHNRLTLDTTPAKVAETEAAIRQRQECWRGSRPRRAT